MNATVRKYLAALTLAALTGSMMDCADKPVPPVGSAKLQMEARRQLRYVASPQEAVQQATQLLKDKDWVTLASYYDLAGSSIGRDELESGQGFWRSQRPATSHPGVAWQYIQPFTPGFAFDHVEPLQQPDVIRVVVKMIIDQGGGQKQIGLQSFEMRKSEKGFQFLPRSNTTATQPAAHGDSASADLIAFRPSIGELVAQLPPATPDSLNALLEAYAKWHRSAAIAPLSGIPRTTIVAGVKSYDASKPELMMSEIARRIEQVLAENPPAKVQTALETAGRTEIHLKCSRIDVHRVDVIGTGPVYFADPPRATEIAFKKMSPF